MLTNGSQHNFLLKKPWCCSCCGVQVLKPDEGGTLQEVGPGYRRLHFELSDKTVTFATFCPDCAAHDWPEERLQLFEDQCQRGWASMSVIPFKKGWRPQDISVLGVSPSYPVQTWAEVQ